MADAAPTHATGGLRDRKKRDTRDALAEAALELFEAQGYDAVTIEAIAEAAGVSRRTFFRYFPSKEAVLFPRRAAHLAALEAALDDPSTADRSPFERVRLALLRVAERVDEGRVLERRIDAIVTRHPALLAHERGLDLEWEAVLAAALRRGAPRTRAARREAAHLAGATMGLVRAVLRGWLADGAQGGLTKIGAEALEVLRPRHTALAPSRGRR